MKHKHHIIPKHMGGTDDPSNFVELTVAEHAEAHRILFEKFGRWEDEVAWKGLSGIIGKEDIIRAVLSAPRLPEHIAKMRKPKSPRTAEHTAKLSAWQKGKPKSLETRARMSAAKRNKNRS